MTLNLKNTGNRIVTLIFDYLFRVWLNVSVFLGICLYLFLRLPPEFFANSRAGALFHDNAFGVLLNFFTQGVEYWWLVRLVVGPLLILFILLSVAIWLVGHRMDKQKARQGYYGFILSVVALFLMVMTPIVATLTEIKERDYRGPIIEENWEAQRAP